MAFKSNGCNTIWFYIVSRTMTKESTRMTAIAYMQEKARHTVDREVSIEASGHRSVELQ